MLKPADRRLELSLRRRADFAWRPRWSSSNSSIFPHLIRDLNF